MQVDLPQPDDPTKATVSPFYKPNSKKIVNKKCGNKNYVNKLLKFKQTWIFKDKPFRIETFGRAG